MDYQLFRLNSHGKVTSWITTLSGPTPEAALEAYATTGSPYIEEGAAYLLLSTDGDDYGSIQPAYRLRDTNGVRILTLAPAVVTPPLRAQSVTL